MCCAVGLSQMKRIKDIIKRRQKTAALYAKKLKGVKELEVPYIVSHNTVSWFVYTVRVSEALRSKRNLIMKKLQERGIGCRDYFQSLHLQPLYVELFGYKRGDFPVTESISDRSIALPFFNTITEKQIDYVVKNLKEIVAELA